MAGAGAAKVATVSSYAMSASVLIAFSSTMLGGGGGGEGFVLEEEGEAGGSCVATGIAEDGNLPGCGDPFEFGCVSSNSTTSASLFASPTPLDSPLTVSGEGVLERPSDLIRIIVASSTVE